MDVRWRLWPAPFVSARAVRYSGAGGAEEETLVCARPESYTPGMGERGSQRTLVTTFRCFPPPPTTGTPTPYSVRRPRRATAIRWHLERETGDDCATCPGPLAAPPGAGVMDRRVGSVGDHPAARATGASR